MSTTIILVPRANNRDRNETKHVTAAGFTGEARANSMRTKTALSTLGRSRSQTRYSTPPIPLEQDTGRRCGMGEGEGAGICTKLFSFFIGMPAQGI